MAVIEAIQTTYLEADVTSVTFEDIPASYEHLQIRMQMKSERAGSDVDGLRVYFGTGGTLDTVAANYGYHWIRGVDTAEAAGGLNGTYLNFQNMLAAQSGATNAANFGTMTLDISDYANGAKNTTCMAVMGSLGNWSNISFESGYWDNVAAVDKIQLEQVNGPNFLRGSEFTLFGLASS